MYSNSIKKVKNLNKYLKKKNVSLPIRVVYIWWLIRVDKFFSYNPILQHAIPRALRTKLITGSKLFFYISSTAN